MAEDEVMSWDRILATEETPDSDLLSNVLARTLHLFRASALFSQNGFNMLFQKLQDQLEEGGLDFDGQSALDDCKAKCSKMTENIAKQAVLAILELIDEMLPLLGEKLKDTAGQVHDEFSSDGINGCDSTACEGYFQRVMCAPKEEVNSEDTMK